MDYTLKKTEQNELNEKDNSLRAMLPFLEGNFKELSIGIISVLLNSASIVAAPLLLGIAIDNAIKNKDFDQLLIVSGILGGIYLVTLITGYLQIQMTGVIGQNVLFKVRNAIFLRLQELPIQFFNQNKSGDLISRINSDTEKLNQFYSEQVIRLIGTIITLIGIGIFIIILNWRLGLVTLAAAGILFVLTNLASPFIKSVNKKSLEALGNFSADISENLNNFKVIIVFNRGDYFKNKLEVSNTDNAKAAKKAGIVSNLTTPLYTLASNIALIAILVYGIVLVQNDLLTIGLLVSYIAFADRFYSPLRELASIWSSIQTSLAAWGRIMEILNLQTNLPILDANKSIGLQSNNIVDFKQVAFGYNKENLVLQDINFSFEPGKTYALVGPTGGGKSTTASLMARLYDPTEGIIYLKGKDIRTYTPQERSAIIGFILQEPFLFTGTLFENLVYGNPTYANVSAEEFQSILEEKQLLPLLAKFQEGLQTNISSANDTISLGQKQLLAFMRTILREPELLILDEATANIDTITESSLQKILDQLPKSTTKVIIAHRLNTIQNADEIIFINAGHIQSAMSFNEALELIKNTKRTS